MISVSTEFRQALANDKRNYLEYATITLTDETVLNLTNENIWSGGFSIDDSVSQDNVFEVGCAIINKATLVINNMYDAYSTYDFDKAVIELSVGLDLGDEDDPDVETVKKGTFIASNIRYNGDLITIEMYDYMSKFDKAYDTELPYPLRLIDILEDSCETCGVELATETFTNSTISISEKPENATHREVISWIAGIAGCFARCNADGELELKWFNTSVLDTSNVNGGVFDNGTPSYTSGDSKDGGAFNPWNTGDVVDGGTLASTSGVHYITERYSGDICVDDVVITCVKVDVKSNDTEGASTTEYISGTEGYAVKVSNNGFINSDNAQAITNSLGLKLIGLRFRPISISHPSDPTIEAGDVACYTDRKGNAYNTLVSRTVFAVGSSQLTECNAETPERNTAERYSEQTKNYVQLRQMIENGDEQAEALISELQAQVESIEVGGTNLLRGTQDYLVSDDEEQQGQLYTQNCTLIGMYKNCAVASYDNTEGSSIADLLAWHEIYVELGKTYVLSFWAKTNTTQEPTIYAYFYGATGYPQIASGVSSEGTENTNTDGLMPFNLSSDWNRYWVRWTIKDTGDISIPKWVLFRITASSDVMIAGVKLEEGTLPTYYSPSPEDTEEELEKIRTASSYGICESSSNSMEKEVTLPHFVLYEGAQFSVMFINGNDAENITMDVNGTGYKSVIANNGEELGGKMNFPSETTASFVYDGSVYRFVASDNLYNVVRWSEESGLDIKASEGSLSRVNINNRSVDVYDENGNVGTSTTKDGFDVYRNGIKIASFGEKTIIGEEDVGSRIELGRSAIEFYEGTSRTAYMAEDKFYFINGEVTQAFFFPHYAIRENEEQYLVIAER